MNLRILKKLSKRAAPLVIELGDRREQFRAEKSENYTDITGHDLKHWERARSVHPVVLGGTMKYAPKHGNGWISMREPVSPIKGTVMVGWTDCCDTPEWYEKTAWEALVENVANYFTCWSQNGPRRLRNLDTPKQVFKAAREILSRDKSQNSKPGNPPFELDEYDDFDDYDVCNLCGKPGELCNCHEGEECGRWRNGRLDKHCTKAGSEECDFECPYSR
jgi:hypothetical protein